MFGGLASGSGREESRSPNLILQFSPRWDFGIVQYSVFPSGLALFLFPNYSRCQDNFLIFAPFLPPQKCFGAFLCVYVAFNHKLNYLTIYNCVQHKTMSHRALPRECITHPQIIPFNSTRLG